MEATAKKGDPMQKTKDDCVANLKKLYPHIKDSDMKTIVYSIFNLLKVTDKNVAQHTKKRPPKKMSEKRKEKNDAFKARKNQEAADRKEARQTPPAADQQNQETEAGNGPDYSIFHEEAKRSREARARVAARMQLAQA